MPTKTPENIFQRIELGRTGKGRDSRSTLKKPIDVERIQRTYDLGVNKAEYLKNIELINLLGALKKWITYPRDVQGEKVGEIINEARASAIRIRELLLQANRDLKTYGERLLPNGQLPPRDTMQMLRICTRYLQMTDIVDEALNEFELITPPREYDKRILVMEQVQNVYGRFLAKWNAIHKATQA